MHSTRTGQFAVIVAGDVIAESLTLLNDDGTPVLEASEPAADQNAIDLLHLDTAAPRSSLRWSTTPGNVGTQAAALYGPERPGLTAHPNRPRVQVGTTGAGLNQTLLTSGAFSIPPAPGNEARVTLDSTAAAGNVRAAALAAGVERSVLNLAATGAADLVAGGALIAQAAGNASVISTAGAALVSAATTTDVQSVAGAATLRSTNASARVLAGTTALVQSVGNVDVVTTAGTATVQAAGNVNLTPGAGGRVVLGQTGRAALALVDMQRTTLGATLSPAPAFAAFIDGGGMTFPNVQAGDMFAISATLRIERVAPGGAFVGALQVFGPAGNVVDPARIIAGVGVPAADDQSYTAVWNYTAALGAGAYTVRIIGGATGGSWNLIAPDTWATAQLFGQR